MLGACSGFGECTARHLAAKGAKVVLTARSVPAMEKIVAEIKEAGGEAACCKLDLTKDEDHVAAFAFAKETYGPVEFLFCNGGTAGMEDNGLKPLHEMTGDDIRVVTDCNYMAVLLGFRYAYDHFKEAGGGAIVINASCKCNALFRAAELAAIPLVTADRHRIYAIGRPWYLQAPHRRRFHRDL